MKKRLKELFDLGMPFFEVLKDENRQRILELITLEGPMSVMDISEKVTISRPSVSHHLQILKRVELVKVEKIGVSRIYSTNLDVVLPYLKELIKEIENIFEKEA